MITLLWTLAGFIMGSLPFSYWIGRAFLKKDIRNYGDGNPGATNVFHAGGLVPFILASMLDAFKAAVPIWLAQLISSVGGWELVPVALAPLAGNVFSPFLRFKGGTGVAALYGTWLALTGWFGPLAIGISICTVFIFIRETPWCTVTGMLIFIIVLLCFHYPVQVAVTAAGHIALVGYNRRSHFTRWPKMQGWVRRFWYKYGKAQQA